MAEREYHRLTFTRSLSSFTVAFQGRTSLWLGKDHLLRVDSSGYVETYKRFYFRDIQAFSITKTKRAVIWNWVLGGLAALTAAGWIYALFAAGSDDRMPINIVFGLFMFLLGVPLVANVLLGPTCSCTVRTAVQSEELASLARLRRAQKVLDRLRPLIVEVQGQLTPEEIPARMRALSESIPPLAPVYPTAAPTPGASTSVAPAQPTRYVVDDLNAPPRIIP